MNYPDQNQSIFKMISYIVCEQLHATFLSDGFISELFGEHSSSLKTFSTTFPVCMVSPPYHTSPTMHLTVLTPASEVWSRLSASSAFRTQTNTSLTYLVVELTRRAFSIACPTVRNSLFMVLTVLYSFLRQSCLVSIRPIYRVNGVIRSFVTQCAM